MTESSKKTKWLNKAIGQLYFWCFDQNMALQSPGHFWALVWALGHLFGHLGTWALTWLNKAKKDVLKFGHLLQHIPSALKYLCIRGTYFGQLIGITPRAVGYDQKLRLSPPHLLHLTSLLVRLLNI